MSKKEYKRVTTHSLREMKTRNEKISMLTGYDYSMAKIIDNSGIDIILVGDSASNVMAGHETTLVVVDLPFGSYQSNSGEALRSAIRIMKESGAHAVKMEGGSEIKESIVRILNAGIPVMGHLGLTPQSIYKFGTYSVRAKEEEEAKRLIEDAKLLDELGCFGIVLEKIPAKISKIVTSSISSPVIGIGAGSDVDGQVLVTHDLVGLTTEFNPRFLRRYVDLNEIMTVAIKNYIKDVKNLDFPNQDEQY